MGVRRVYQLKQITNLISHAKNRFRFHLQMKLVFVELNHDSVTNFNKKRGLQRPKKV